MPPTGTKRPFSGSGGGHRGGKPPRGNYQGKRGGHGSTGDGGEQSTVPTPTGPYISMFTGSRNELDEHHDRRERVIKASRDITAASKKIIFTLQRLRPSHLPMSSLPPYILKEVKEYEDKIRSLLKSLLPDLQGINGYKYQRQISGGIQEYLEAVSFRCYLTHGRLIKFDEASEYVNGLWEDEEDQDQGKVGEEGDVEMQDAEAGGTSTTEKVEDVAGVDEESADAKEEKRKLEGIKLTKEDYLLALFDMTGELMRFAITSIATTPLSQLVASPQNQQTPLAAPTSKPETEKEADDKKKTPTAQLLLQTLRQLRLSFETLDYGNTHVGFGKDAEKKMLVMRECVEKVEYGFYGMVVRGSERPEGWVADASDQVGGGRDGYAGDD